MTPTGDRREMALNRALLLLAPTVTIIVAAEFIVVGLLPLVSQDLPIPLAQAGALTGWFAFSAVAAGPFVTLLASRLSPRFILTATLLLFTVGNAVVATASDFDVILLARVIQGAMLPAFISVGASVVTRLAPPSEHGKGLAHANIGFVLGVLLALPAGVALAQGGNWRLPFLVLAAASLPMAVLVTLLFPAIPGGNATGPGNRVQLIRRSAPAPDPKRIVIRQGLIDHSTRTALSIARLSASAPSFTTCPWWASPFRRHRVRCFMEQEVGHGEKAVYAGVQA